MLNGCNLGLFEEVKDPESFTVELMDIWYGDSSPTLDDPEDPYSFYVYFNFMLDGARYEHKFLASDYYGPNKLSCAVSAKKDVWDPYYTTTFDIESATKFGSNTLHSYMHSIYDLTPYGYTSDNFGTYENAYLSTKFSVGAITNDLLNFFNEDLYDDDTLLMVEPFIETLKVSVGEVKYDISASEAASYMGVPSGSLNF